MNSKIVKVRALDGGDGGIDFEVDGIKAKQAVLKLDKDGGVHNLRFDLHDNSSRGLKFDAGDPIWVSEDSDCPPASGINSDQIAVTSIGDRSLEATNQNSGRPRDLRYQLNFVASDGSRAECDPIISNGGGIKPPSD